MSNQPALFPRYLPFTSDYGFKVTFGNEHNTLFLRRALQALIQTPEPIEWVEFDKTSIEGMTKKSRGGLLDLTCHTSSGDIFIVEMQLDIFDEMLLRLQFYGWHKMDTHVRKGDFTFKGLPKIYAIGILGFNLLEGEDYRTVISLRDEKGKLVDSRVTFVLVELEKFKKTPENCVSDLDKLLYTMKEAHALAVNGNAPDFMEEDWLAVALRELDQRNMSPDDYANLSIMVAKEKSERHNNAWLKSLEDKAEAKAYEFEVRATQAETKATQAETKATQAETKATQAETKATQAEMKARMAEENTLKRTIRAVILTMGLSDEQIVKNLEAPVHLVRQVRLELEDAAGKN